MLPNLGAPIYLVPLFRYSGKHLKISMAIYEDTVLFYFVCNITGNSLPQFALESEAFLCFLHVSHPPQVVKARSRRGHHRT